MNCSSVVIKFEKNKADFLIQKINGSDLCEYHLHKEDSLIVTIEAENTEKEVSALKEIQKWDGVVSAELVYSYCEDNISILQDNVEIQDDIPQVLTDDSLKAEQIQYNGDLKKSKI